MVHGNVSDADLTRMGRGRGIIDFVSSLTDAQTIAFGTRLGGASGFLWSSMSLRAPIEPLRIALGIRRRRRRSQRKLRLRFVHIARSAR